MKSESNILYLLNEEEANSQKQEQQDTHNKIAVDDKASIKQEGYNSDIDPVSTFSIYIKALEKIINLLDNAVAIVNEINNLKNTSNIKDEEADKIIQNKINLTDIISNIEEIVSEFIKAFSVISDPQKKELFEYLHNQFNNIDFNIKFFFVRHELKYADNALKVCHSLVEIFKRFKSILNSNNDQNIGDKEISQEKNEKVISKQNLGKDV